MEITHYTRVATEMHSVADGHVLVQDANIKEQLASDIFEYMNEDWYGRC